MLDSAQPRLALPDYEILILVLCFLDSVLQKQSYAQGIFLFRTGLTGLEPATSAVTGRCSNQLNYRPNFLDLY